MKIVGVCSLGSGDSQRWQVYHAKMYFGTFRHHKDAIAAKAAAMDISTEALIERSGSTRSSCEEPSQYVGVTRVVKGNKEFWQAWAPRSCGPRAGYVGTATSAKRAAALLEDHLGKPPEKKHKSTWFDCDRQVEHFKALMDLYTHQDGEPE